MKATIKKSVFLIAVRAEIKRIKRLATKEEIDRLNFLRFEHWSMYDCIYGQMTGRCSSNRAKEIMPKSFDDVCNLKEGTFKHKQTFVKHDFTKGTEYTALEKYLYMCNKPTHLHIIQFLKGEVDTLVIE